MENVPCFTWMASANGSVTKVSSSVHSDGGRAEAAPEGCAPSCADFATGGFPHTSSRKHVRRQQKAAACSTEFERGFAAGFAAGT
eukprot:1520857-Prymnesium_polylepis.2